MFSDIKNFPKGVARHYTGSTPPQRQRIIVAMLLFASITTACTKATSPASRYAENEPRPNSYYWPNLVDLSPLRQNAAQGLVPDAHDSTKRHAPIMLTTDLALKFDPEYAKISKCFLDNPKEFEQAFARPGSS